MKLVSVAEMRAIEEEANTKGLSFPKMMENAGKNVAKIVSSLPLPSGKKEVFGLIGPGNNGGDTLIALAQLQDEGWNTHAYLIYRTKEDDPLINKIENKGGQIFVAKEDKNFHHLLTLLKNTNIILDGILGTGIKLPLIDDIAIILGKIKTSIAQMSSPPIIIGIDCPSGMDCDTGEVADQTLVADMTVVMAAVKQGLLKFPANNMVGTIKVAEIGDLSRLDTWNDVRSDIADESMIKGMIPRRTRDSHKGSFGTTVIIAGSINFTGAALLAGKASAKTGIGLVTLAIPAPLHSALAGHFPEATWILLPHELGVIAEDALNVIQNNIDRASAILIGPGIGTQQTTVTCISRLLTEQNKSWQSNRRIGFLHKESPSENFGQSHLLPPLIIDADGLRILAKIPSWAEVLPPNSILTPHPGEMSILTSLSVAEIQSDRMNIARKFAEKWGQVVVLKGAFTIIASPDGRSTIIPVASAALAHAGTGDVLAGLITGYRGQGLPPYEAAITGAWIHAQAGLIAAEDAKNTASVLASDIIGFIGTAISQSGN